MSFPLYNTLLQSITGTNSGEETVDKVKLIKSINQMDQDGHNKVYALIRYYCINNNVSMTEMNWNDDEFTFNLDKFPVELQQVLSEFGKLHTKHMKHIQKLEKIQNKKKS